VSKREPKTQADKLVKELKSATQTAEELAAQIAEGIRNERRAGLPFKASDAPPPKPTRRRTSRKKR
jgi:hypothetical protein